MKRRPHAALDKHSRYMKARKIERIVGARLELSGAKVLDIGAGSGFISEYFHSLVGRDGVVVATDRINQLQTSMAIEFHKVNDTNLPLEDACFDLIIYNHVIEHVGERNDQVHHLREIHRVLKPGGMVYLAVPSRWALIEPHYGLPLLSWFPRSLSSSYVRLMRKGKAYDCAPLGSRALRELIAEAGFHGEDIRLEAVRVFLEIERPGAVGACLRHTPEVLLRSLRAMIPMLVFVLRKKNTGSVGRGGATLS